MNKPTIETACKNCIFAKYDGITQVGCFFNRIEKYRQQGAEVVEAKDDEKEFYVIQNRLCMACRDESWKLNTYPNHSIPTLAELVRTQMTMRNEAWIFVDDIEKFALTLKSLDEQEQVVSCVVAVIEANGKVQPSRVQKLLKEQPNWRYSVLPDRSTYDSKLDFVAEKCQAPCFAVFQNGYHVPANFFSSIDYALHDEMQRFVVLRPDKEGNGFWTQTKLYKHIRKDNHQDSFLLQVTRLAESQNSLFLIKDAEEIWKRWQSSYRSTTQIMSGYFKQQPA